LGNIKALRGKRVVLAEGRMSFVGANDKALA